MKKILTVFFILNSFHSFAQNNTKDFFYVKTGDSLPYLKYGTGVDRLGGAKISPIDSNVVLKVVDSFETDYKVQLSAYHSAWIEKANVQKIQQADSEFQHLTDSWKVFGDSLFDYVTIQLDEKLPYTSRMELDPSLIVVDIYGAVSNTNWIQQLGSAREIKNVWYEQPEDDVIRVFIELIHPQHWGYSVYYDDSNKLTVRVKRQPASLALKDITIAIDAGHGGTNMGTTGSSKDIREKDITLLFAKDIENELRSRKAKVVMTRVNDTTLSMYDRITFLNQQDPDLLISIHLNESDEDTVRGVSTYYRYVAFRPLSKAILHRLLETGLNEFGNIGSFNFALNGPTDYPDCLVEVAFLSNKDDEQKILDPEFRTLVAKKIADGVEDFLKSIQ
ncbi:MAG TPA: N-acetylmuramoyl-L-alanine amidase [Chitinophagaceae bacterium]|nr:N-acetylmuramoyl-L-alanine amidase [Chitinophagaceae bacterium]